MSFQTFGWECVNDLEMCRAIRARAPPGDVIAGRAARRIRFEAVPALSGGAIPHCGALRGAEAAGCGGSNGLNHKYM